VQVVQLFRKPQRGVAVVEQDSLMLQRGYGIVGDSNAIAGSPRQVLLTSTPVLAEFDLKPGALRENILLDSAIEPIPSGAVVQIGAIALVRLTSLCEPCAYLETLQPGLARRIQSQRGRLGMVVADGRIQVGDRVVVTNKQFPPLPDDAKGKFMEFVARIPPGKVVRTVELLLGLGLTKSYARVIPTWMKQAAPGLPVHRIIAADRTLFTQHLPYQQQMLAKEGVELVDRQVSAVHEWNPLCFHALGDF
jgi:alkylated DNA nucleotide flippase Atl1